MAAPGDPAFDPFSDKYAGRDQANAQKALAMGKDNLQILKHAHAELRKLGQLSVRGKLSLIAGGDLKKLQGELDKTTTAIEKTGKALDKAFKSGNAAQIAKQTKAMRKHADQMERTDIEASQLLQTNSKMARVQETMKSSWLRFASAGMAAGLAFKALEASSTGAQFAIGDLISQGKHLPETTGVITDMFGKKVGGALSAAADKTKEYILVQHDLAFAAARTGRSIEEMTEQARNIQFRLHPKGMKELVNLTEQTSMLARFLKIDMSTAVDFLVERQRRFGDSTEHTTTTMAFMVKMIKDANSAFGAGTIEVDEFSDLMMDASRSSKSYAQNLRGLSKIIRNHIVDVQLQGGSYRKAMDSAKELLNFIQDTPKHIEFMAGEELFDKFQNLDKAGVEDLLGDLKGKAKVDAVAAVMEIKKLHEVGLLNTATARQHMTQEIGQTMVGMEAILNVLKTKGVKDVAGLMAMMEMDTSKGAEGRAMMKMLISMGKGTLKEHMERTRRGKTSNNMWEDDGAIVAEMGTRTPTPADTTSLGKEMTGLQLMDVANQLRKAQAMLSNPLVAAGGAAVAALLAVGLGAKILQWAGAVKTNTGALWASTAAQGGGSLKHMWKFAKAAALAVGIPAAQVALAIGAPVAAIGGAVYATQKMIDNNLQQKHDMRMGVGGYGIDESYYTDAQIAEVNTPEYLAAMAEQNAFKKQQFDPGERIWNKMDFQQDKKGNIRDEETMMFKKRRIGGSSKLNSDGSATITEIYTFDDFQGMVAESNHRTARQQR